MTARHKLNSAYLNGAIIVVGLLGAVTGSYLVFFIALAGLIGASVLSGEIRR